MDQLSASNFAMDSSAVPNPTEGMSSPSPTPPDNANGAATSAAVEDASSRQHPIPPASEPMQYRAIGLVYGQYTPSEEQFTKGNLITEDGTVIDSVLLGRVMSLVKKHIDLEKPHLWVVYPRTREKQYDLHLQIMGIWEPENLSQADNGNGEDDESEAPASADEAVDTAIAASETEESATETEETAEAELPEAEDEAIAQSTDEAETETAETSPSAASAATSAATTEATATISEGSLEKAGGAIAESTNGYFSIRGEVLFYSEEHEEENLVVRIQQSPKKEGKPPKAFKLILSGKIEGRTVGYFWELHAQREGNRLVVQDGKMIAMVPPKKNKKRRPGPGGPPRPRRQNDAPRKPWKKGSEGRDSSQSTGDVQKPVKRPKRVMKPLGGE